MKKAHGMMIYLLLVQLSECSVFLQRACRAKMEIMNLSCVITTFGDPFLYQKEKHMETFSKI